MPVSVSGLAVLRSPPPPSSVAVAVADTEAGLLRDPEAVAVVSSEADSVADFSEALVEAVHFT